MREIKFRAWRISNNSMIRSNQALATILKRHILDYPEAGLHDTGGANDYVGDGEYVLMQYTGLKDKKYNPIFEGDIILRSDLTPHYVITWINESGGWFLVHKDMRMPLSDIYGKEIIGNIYENPELLKRHC